MNSADDPSIRSLILVHLQDRATAVEHGELCEYVERTHDRDPDAVEETVRALEKRGEIYNVNGEYHDPAWKVTST